MAESSNDGRGTIGVVALDNQGRPVLAHQQEASDERLGVSDSALEITPLLMQLSVVLGLGKTSLTSVSHGLWCVTDGLSPRKL